MYFSNLLSLSSLLQTSKACSQDSSLQFTRYPYIVFAFYPFFLFIPRYKFYFFLHICFKSIVKGSCTKNCERFCLENHTHACWAETKTLYFKTFYINNSLRPLRISIFLKHTSQSVLECYLGKPLTRKTICLKCTKLLVSWLFTISDTMESMNK